MDTKKSRTKILTDIAKKYGLSGHSAIIKTFQNNFHLLEEYPQISRRYRLKYNIQGDTFYGFKPKPTIIIFEIATDDELISIGQQLDN
jgi:hypothetical protein